MNCEQAIEILLGEIDSVSSREEREATEHAGKCEECSAALTAHSALKLERSNEPPPPLAGAFARAVAAATSAGRVSQAGRRPFLFGMAAGVAVAASVALAVVVALYRPSPPDVPGAALTPHITMALNEARLVNISLDTVAAMSGARIRVLVNGDIALDGYAGQRELRWTTDLVQGSNQLTIPVVAVGGGGGQLLVEVEHEARQRRFLVDVAGAG